MIRQIAIALPLVTTVAACDSASTVQATQDDTAVIQSFRGPQVRITYNPDTDIYLVYSTVDEPQRFVGNPSFDARGFDSAGGLAYRALGEAEVAVLLFGGSAPEDGMVHMQRGSDTTIPDSGAATYAGDYYGYLFSDDFFEGEVTGDASIDVAFGAGGTVSGTISNRQIFFVTDPDTGVAVSSDLTLVAVGLTADGQVALDGIDRPRVTSSDFTIGDTEFISQGGRYAGMLAGPDGANFIGGVFVEYVTDTTGTGLGTAQEIGAIAATRSP